MNKTNKLISMLLAAAMLLAFLPSVAVATDTETIILYTNDVHCAIENYAVLAAYKADTMRDNVIEYVKTIAEIRAKVEYER